MTTAPPPVNLRARVLREIGSGRDEAKASYHSAPYRSASSHMSPSHMWWLAAAAGIVLAAYLGWPERPTIGSPPPPVVRTLDGLRVPTPAMTAADPTPRDRRTPDPGALDPAMVSIPALEAPAAIGIAPLDATLNPLPALDAVEPLDLEQLDIKPLTPPGPAAGGQ
jgi:hypothetical protein